MRWLGRHPSALVALGLLLASVAAWWLTTRGPRAWSARVTRMDLEQHLVASGRVWVPTRVSISTQIAGLVIAVGAVEGQRVRAGDLLVQLDDAEARAAFAQVKAAVDQAAARVQQLRKVGSIVANESYRQAETNLQRAETELERSRTLAATGSLALAALQDAQRAVDIARAQRTAAQAQQLAAAPMGADSRAALSALLETQARLSAASVRLEQTRIVARQDGQVLAREVEPGDVAQPSRTLLVMAADTDPQLVIEPDERNLAWIRVGQLARAAADARPEQTFDAEVSYIAPAVDAQRGSVEIRLRVPHAPDFLIPDMTVSVDLTVAKKPRVLTLPSEAVRGAATASPYVLLAADGRVAAHPVKLGIRGEGRVEIASGLAEGERVLVETDRPLTLGQRVRPQDEAR